MSSSFRFDADEVGFDDSNQVLSVGVASSSGSYFLIQRPLDIENLQPSDLYTEHDDQHKGAYGALKRLELNRTQLKAQLIDGTTIIADLKISDDQMLILESKLQIALDGFDILYQEL